MTGVLPVILAEYRKTKSLADGAIAQLGDADLFVKINPRQNSIAAIMRHLAGNMRSRFTDFLTTDGEKPWRDREREFDDSVVSRGELLDLWESGWQCLLGAVEALTDVG